MARRSDHSREEIRDMALAAAERIVDDEGFAGLSARKIAGRIGYTVGTLYLVFENIDELILHVNARTLDSLYGALREASAEGTLPEARVLALARAYIGFASRHTRQWGMLYEHRLPEGVKVPEWYREKVARSFALVEEAIRPLVKDAKNVGPVARALWAGVHGVCLLGLTDKLDVVGAGSVQVLVETLVANFLKGLASGAAH